MSAEATMTMLKRRLMFVAVAAACNIVMAALPAYLPDYFRTSKDDWFPTKMAKLTSGEATCPVIRDIYQKVQDELMPVTVEGDIQWGVNRTKTGWLVWLINNRGVTKFAQEPEVLDPKATSRVKVTFKPTGKTVEIDVPAGQVRTVEI